MATSSINIPERDSSTGADTTMADDSSVNGNADTTSRVGESNSVDHQPSERNTYSEIIARRTESLHQTETTTAMIPDNKFQL